MTARRRAALDRRPLMTMRVIRIRDGRIVEERPEVRIMNTDRLDPLSVSTWPPCECPRCRRKQ
ncbi:hypothetical protein QEP66_01180 [Streptomyces sp. LB8]|uniref:hypothetical protein n=1 Tax=Streptomyces sp. LB8 TaxID=3042509 RepID=UPI0026486F4B|nr:hypothetical protein [Streptomyces sp. LB8]MDN5380744.1 hypothetical protein [Streptomyces sp. LB8]